MNVSKVNVLCMMAHPDDAEIICGGSLIKLIDQGYKVAIVDFSKGEMGTRGSVEQRGTEAECATKIMGVDIRINLGLPDSMIENNIENRKIVVEAIRKLAPELVITHSLQNNRNPDHTHTAALVKEAIFTAGLAKYDTGQEPHRPKKIIYSMEYFDFIPSIIVDITDQYERKMNAVNCYKSQLYNPNSDDRKTYIASDRFIREMDSRFRYYGSKIHCDYGEAFMTDNPLQIDDLVAEIALRAQIPGPK
jgi:bacillithiol biosynthesis deacetylase BshB1